MRRKPARPDELQEIMKVPEIRKAIAMQQKNQRQEALERMLWLAKWMVSRPRPSSRNSSRRFSVELDSI